MAIGFDRSGRNTVLLRCATGAAIALLVATAFDSAFAQAQRHPMCTRLEAQLANVDRGEGGDGRADQIRRYEEALARQQQELERMTAQARRAGCGGGGFFLFGGGQPPQCDQINGQIERMRANLDRIMTGLRQLQGSGGSREEQRRAILISLSQYDCGPQYRTAGRQRGFFEMLFGAPPPPSDAPPPPGEATQNTTFRTLCVRTCDGYFYPISNSTSQARFQDDARTCQRTCPASEVTLFSHRNPGEDVAQAVSVNGQPYSSMPNAFRYRQEFNASCTCKSAGESWTQAVGDDPSLERGDIVVTEENAKTVAQPRQEPAQRTQQQRQQRGRERANATPAPQGGASGPNAPRGGGSSTTGSGDGNGTPVPPPRSIGPQFYR